MDEFDRTDVKTARRLLGNEERRLVSKLARDHDFLEVSAGKRPNRLPFAANSDPEAPDEASRSRCDGRVIDEEPMGERGHALKAHRQIVRGRGFERGA